MEKIRENVNTAFYIRHAYSYRLRNIDDDTVIVYYFNKGSPWVNKLSAAEKWLSEQETKRLAPDNVKRPSTKWKFVSFFNVDVKVVLDRQPLLGTGPLPDWLRNLARGRAGPMVALDTYQDNLCLWRCIAVHQGALPHRSTAAARGLAKRFFKLATEPTDCPKTSLDELDKVERHLNKGLPFSDWLGIRVYEPEVICTYVPVNISGIDNEMKEKRELIWHLKRNSPEKINNVLTIGTYEGHAFVIKDIEKLAKIFSCTHCNARFTKVCNLKWHTQTCSQGKTIIDCPGKKGEEPQTSFEKAFYPSHQASKESLRWLDQEAKRRKIHIHHAMCGHGGEPWIEKAPVDGYDPISKTVFQYHGCHWHGCLKCFPTERDKKIFRFDQTRDDRLKATLERTSFLRQKGYNVVEIWACEAKKINGTSYEKWVKAYGCELKKSWFPYEWFDSSEKLDYPGLPDYQAWFSKLKNAFVLTKAELEVCNRIFEEKKMKTFADWLRYYNNLDVAPGLEALEKMKAFYTEKGIDIFKDAVSIPGVSLHYLMRGSIERGADLYSPSKEAYDMLKGAVVGGPSIVFTRYHEAFVSKIRDHQIENPKLCKNIVGYDANALYLSTMLEEMPCGNEEVLHFFGHEEEEAVLLTRDLKGARSWFGFAEVDIEIPEKLWKKFEEMPPFFYNKEVPGEAVPNHMLEYLQKTKRNRGDGKKLVGALSAKMILLYAPLLRWYVKHGAVIKAVYRRINYQPKKIFPWFVEQVTEARRTGDVDKSKALLADVFKLLGNSA
ncbi:hypothetical protein ACROYT_G032790 [Oculina patagonica]